MEQLLKILEDNARLPIEDIATMLNKSPAEVALSLIHISEPTRQEAISYAVFCL